MPLNMDQLVIKNVILPPKQKSNLTIVDVSAQEPMLELVSKIIHAKPALMDIIQKVNATKHAQKLKKEMLLILNVLIVRPIKNKIQLTLPPVNVNKDLNLVLAAVETVKQATTLKILVTRNALPTPFLMGPLLLVQLVMEPKDTFLMKELLHVNVLPMLPI